MDDRQRRLRIERMKREKQRQLRRRKRQKMIIKRCVMIAACVIVVLLGISAIWGLVKPDKAGNDTEEAVVNVEAGTETEETAEAEQTESTEPEAVTEEEAQVTTVASDGVNQDGPAQTAVIKDSSSVKYAVPGWQVDDNGWWYAIDDSSYYANGWQEIDGQEYYFNYQGYMQTGWAVVGSRGCYFSDDGIYDPDKESKMIAMTFDDGPGQYTGELLDVLEENGAKATFFMLGENIETKGADIIPRMVELGCELGNHSYDHPNLKNLSTEEIQKEFAKTDELIAGLADGAVSTVARTPFGSQDESVTNAIGKPCIYWSLDTLDWETKNVESNISVVLNNVEDGEIVLMHDIWPTTVEACKTIIPKLVEEGYQLVTVSELATAKGVNLEDGVTYYDFYSRAEESEDTTEE